LPSSQSPFAIRIHHRGGTTHHDDSDLAISRDATCRAVRDRIFLRRFMAHDAAMALDCQFANVYRWAINLWGTPTNRGE
jgi:hypothetical protein